MTAVQRVVAIAVGALILVLIAALSRVPIVVHDSSNALLRVAMSARPERIEQCRAVSDEELASTPEHMRQRTICEGAAAAYLLEVLRDGRMLTRDTVRGGGLRNDRQLYVFADLVVPSGASDIEVRFNRIDPASPAAMITAGDSNNVMSSQSGDDREQTARSRRAADAVPGALLFRETMSLSPREVILVTYDRESRSLRATRAP